MKAAKTIIGLTEKVRISGGKGKSKVITARIDTGATISSIDSRLATKICLGPVVETKVVKSAHGNRKRPVVIAELVIAGKKKKAGFTIADRRHMKYAMLIGQNILKQGFLIDPSKNRK